MGNSCSFGLLNVFMVLVPYCYLRFFSNLGFWSGNLFLIAPCPDRCLLVPFNSSVLGGFILLPTWADPEGGTGGPDPLWNCTIINFCHVEIFRQTPSGNLDPPPTPLRKFSGSAHVQESCTNICLIDDISE